jgi:hypothetical protein
LRCRRWRRRRWRWRWKPNDLKRLIFAFKQKVVAVAIAHIFTVSAIQKRLLLFFALFHYGLYYHRILTGTGKDARKWVLRRILSIYIIRIPTLTLQPQRREPSGSVREVVVVCPRYLASLHKRYPSPHRWGWRRRWGPWWRWWSRRGRIRRSGPQRGTPFIEKCSDSVRRSDD